jgi:SAM-dependent methyltransferase
MSDKLPKDMTMAERRALYSKHRHPPTTDREARNLERVLWLFREMPRIKPATVLDIGCESGFITRWMVDEPYVTKLFGVDPCEFSIEHAKSLVKKRTNADKALYEVKGWEDADEQLRNIVAKPGSPGHVGLFSVPWDAIVCFEVIEHFLPEEGVELIKKIHSLLAPGRDVALNAGACDDEILNKVKVADGTMDKKRIPGGTAFLCTPSATGRYGLSNPDPWHLKIYTLDELVKLVKDVTGVSPDVSEDDPDFIMLKWRKP